MTLHEFLKMQIDEIDRHKWIESQKVGYDLGENAVRDWVDHYAADFRRYIHEQLGECIEFPDGRQAPPIDFSRDRDNHQYLAHA